jgi:hypothetical protein
MKKIIVTIFSIILVINVSAQKYFSKMFDLYGHWESFMYPLEINEDSIILIGEKQNFFVTDSTRFKSLSIVSVYNNSIFEKKYLFGKDTFQVGIINFYSPSNKKRIITFEQDTKEKTYGKSSYWLNEMNITFDSLLSKIQLPISNSFYVLNGTNFNNKLYFFCADYTTFVASKLKLSMQCMDTNGNLLWGKVFQDKRCYTNNVVQTKDGNFILAGLKYYGEGLGGDDSAFAWYAKVDTMGTILWEQVLDRGSKLMSEATAITKADNSYYLTGTVNAKYTKTWYGDTSFCFMAKINENNGEIEWQKRFLYSVNTIQGLNDGFGGIVVYKNNYLYALIDHNVSERENPGDYSQYVMLAKLDLQGNILWKRLFSNWYQSNRAYSLTPIADGFLICGDAKDSTHTNGDSDAWLIKTDTNGCIIPNCNAKDGLVQILNPERILTVFPNPAQNEIKIETNFDKLNYQNIMLSKFYVYNLQGQILLTQPAQNQNADSINTENLSNGTYLIVIELTNGSQAVKKVVIER